MPPAIVAAPIITRPDIGTLMPAKSGHATGHDRQHALGRPSEPTTLLGFSTIQPLFTTCDSSFESNVETDVPNFGRSSASM